MRGKAAKWNLRGLKVKVARWANQVGAAQLESVKAYGAEAAKMMVKCTPPGNARVAVGKALKALKERIRQDFEGTEKPFSDEDIEWRYNRQGELYATIRGKEGGRPSPFRVYTGRVSAAKLKALGAGGHGVEHATNVRSFMAARPKQYRMRRRKNAMRLSWVGTRHVASQAAVRAEMKRRQKRAGTLMAGWKALAAKSGAKLPSAVQKQSGKGSASIKRSMSHKAVLEAHNRGNYKGLQVIVDRQLPGLRKRLRNMARKRAKQLGKKLK